MSYRVIFAPEARAELRALDRYISREGSPEIAARFVDGLIARCAKLSDFPFRGSPRDDIREGVRTVAHRRRATIAYMVEDDCVTILRIFYGGQDFSGLSDS